MARLCGDERPRPSKPSGARQLLPSQQGPDSRWCAARIVPKRSHIACPAQNPDAQAHWKLNPPSWPVTSTTSPMK